MDSQNEKTLQNLIRYYATKCRDDAQMLRKAVEDGEANLYYPYLLKNLAQFKVTPEKLVHCARYFYFLGYCLKHNNGIPFIEIFNNAIDNSKRDKVINAVKSQKTLIDFLVSKGVDKADLEEYVAEKEIIEYAIDENNKSTGVLKRLLARKQIKRKEAIQTDSFGIKDKMTESDKYEQSTRVFKEQKSHEENMEISFLENGLNIVITNKITINRDGFPIDEKENFVHTIDDHGNYIIRSVGHENIIISITDKQQNRKAAKQIAEYLSENFGLNLGNELLISAKNDEVYTVEPARLPTIGIYINYISKTLNYLGSVYGLDFEYLIYIDFKKITNHAFIAAKTGLYNKRALKKSVNFVKEWFYERDKIYLQKRELFKDSQSKLVLPEALPPQQTKTEKETPKTFEELFYNTKHAEPCLRILNELQPPVIDALNNYIGKAKGVFPLWIKVLTNHKPEPLIKHFKDLIYKDLLNQKIKGLNLTKDASEFRKQYIRLENNKTELDIKTILSQYSQSGKLGK
jgi:hypothetical protein